MFDLDPFFDRERDLNFRSLRFYSTQNIFIATTEEETGAGDDFFDFQDVADI
jgi:hypothetical protein